jgi:hypothetical protein
MVVAAPVQGDLLIAVPCDIFTIFDEATWSPRVMVLAAGYRWIWSICQI